MTLPKDPKKAEEIRKKMSDSAKQRMPPSEESRKKMSESQKKKYENPEERRKCGDKRRGEKLTDNHRKNISRSLKGHIKSEDHRKHLSESQKGKPGHIPSEETKRRMSQSNKGKVRSEGTRKRISESRKGIPNPMIGKKHTDKTKIKQCESKVGGFWIGNIRYPTSPIYCELWKDVNPRVHAFFDYKCVLCGQPENGRSHIGHHVFYVKEACCWYSDEGIYYTNLNVRKHPAKDYYIGVNPNYFVILCNSCHSKTNGGFENRKRYANLFKQMIDDNYGGKSYLTKEEYASISGSSQTDHRSGD